MHCDVRFALHYRIQPEGHHLSRESYGCIRSSRERVGAAAGRDLQVLLLRQHRDARDLVGRAAVLHVRSALSLTEGSVRTRRITKLSHSLPFLLISNSKHEDIQTSFESVEQAAASVGQENPVADPQQLTSTSTSPEPNAAAASSSQVPDETPLSADNEPLRGSSISTPEQQVAEPSLIIPVEAQPSSNNDLSPVARTQV